MAAEWAWNRRWPIKAGTDRQAWVQFYLDDFDAPEVAPLDEAESIKGTMSATHAT